ncbi:hypothetical protein LY90DRAFT_666670 [Neocallimastix californiae]|uniref:Autophagy-related protein 11 C-terminal domain-containing protein n=1 Tax=Neocallimastix californiae TaxID=1754190 RepID=A0A1Y2ENX7_9FUNG|nr:hypothetical protein LY90DRAFT_666670 [Neocallimastix californiae]|eukprot:ORY73283.1 hypothetical protein LY90DRAFT_666670 [Neocallimastix californiae]
MTFIEALTGRIIHVNENTPNEVIPKEIQKETLYLPLDQIYLLNNGREIRFNEINRFSNEKIFIFSREILEKGIPQELINGIKLNNNNIQTLIDEIKNQHEIWYSLSNHLREQLIEVQEKYNNYNQSIKDYFVKFEFLLNCYDNDMEIVQELPASLINSKQITDAIPREKIDLWKTRCQQESSKLMNEYGKLKILFNNLYQNSYNELNSQSIKKPDYSNEMMSILFDKIKRIQTISNDKYIFDMDFDKLIEYMDTIDIHFNQLDYFHNIPIFWYATLLEIIRRKHYNNLIDLKFAVFKEQLYDQEQKRKNEFKKRFQQFFNLNYIELDDKTSKFTPVIYNFCDNFPLKEYIEKNEILINKIIKNYNHEEYQNFGTSLYPIIEKMKNYIQELEDAIKNENNKYINDKEKNTIPNEYYEKQIKELKLKNSQLNEKIQQMDKTYEDEKKSLLVNINKLKEEKQELTNLLNYEKENSQKLKEENEEFKKTIELLKSKLDNTKESLKNKENEIVNNSNVINSNNSMNGSSGLEDWISLCHYSIEQLMIYYKNVCKLLNQDNFNEPETEECQDLFKYVQSISSVLENDHIQKLKVLQNQKEYKLKFNSFETNDLVLFSKTNDPEYYSMFSPLSDIPYFLKTSEHKNIINSTPYLLSYIISIELRKSDEKEIPLEKDQPYYLVKVRPYS